MSVLAVEKDLSDYGNRYLRCIDSVQCVIAISAKAYNEVLPSKRHQAVGKQSGTTPATQSRFNCTIRNLSISRSSEDPLQFMRSWTIILEQSGTLFTTTMRPYLFNTTRLLYRLSQSQHRDQFILKGAMLFSVWSNEPHRATRDMDLLIGASVGEYLEKQLPSHLDKYLATNQNNSRELYSTVVAKSYEDWLPRGTSNYNKCPH